MLYVLSDIESLKEKRNIPLSACVYQRGEAICTRGKLSTAVYIIRYEAHAIYFQVAEFTHNFHMCNHFVIIIEQLWTRTRTLCAPILAT